jgi:hypothetical protein
MEALMDGSPTGGVAVRLHECSTSRDLATEWIAEKLEIASLEEEIQGEWIAETEFRP